MDPVQLCSPVLDGGRLRSVNFFNGRLLSAEDLRDQAGATAEADRRLARAVGDGVAYGFEVRKAAASDRFNPQVTVEPGLALNRNGGSLYLDAPVTVSLVRPRANGNGAAANGNGVRACDAFSDFLPPQTGTFVAGAGAYVLTVCPAEGREGSAPVSGLGNAPAACNTRYRVEGVKFRLLQLDVEPSVLNDRDRARNRIAYQCFDAARSAAFLVDPFAPAATASGAQNLNLLDRLRARTGANRLGDAEVPLAVVYWTAAVGIEFVDVWPAWRRISAGAPAGFGAFGSDRSAAEAEARFHQFQAHVDDLLAASPDLRTFEARQRFDRLPPVGFLPLFTQKHRRGFDHISFFRGLTVRNPVFMDGARVAPLVRTSFDYPPADLSTGEMLWLYRVRQNMQAIDANPASPPRQYLVFSTGFVPYHGDAQFDLSYWNFANYSSR